MKKKYIKPCLEVKYFPCIFADQTISGITQSNKNAARNWINEMNSELNQSNTIEIIEFIY